MNKIIKCRKIIILFIAVIGILFGIFIFKKINIDNMNYIIENTKNMKYMSSTNILLHIVLLSTSFLFSFTAIGIFIVSLYLFFETMVIGFMSSCFVSLYKINGIYYSFIYILLYKAFIILLFIILLFKYIKIYKNIINYLKKKPVDITKTIINTIITIFLILIYDTFLLMFGQNLINIFSFLIK